MKVFFQSKKSTKLSLLLILISFILILNGQNCSRIGFKALAEQRLSSFGNLNNINLNCPANVKTNDPFSCSAIFSGNFVSWKWVVENSEVVGCQNQTNCSWQSAILNSYPIQIIGIDTADAVIYSNIANVNLVNTFAGSTIAIFCQLSSGSSIDCSAATAGVITEVIWNLNSQASPSCDSKNSCAFGSLNANTYTIQAMAQDGLGHAIHSNSVSLTVSSGTVSSGTGSIATGPSVPWHSLIPSPSPENSTGTNTCDPNTKPSTQESTLQCSSLGQFSGTYTKTTSYFCAISWRAVTTDNRSTCKAVETCSTTAPNTEVTNHQCSRFGAFSGTYIQTKTYNVCSGTSWLATITDNHSQACIAQTAFLSCPATMMAGTSITCTGTTSITLANWSWFVYRGPIASSNLIINNFCSNQSSCTWGNVAPGNYTVQGIAIDSAGNRVQSNGVTVTVAPITISINCPTSGNTGSTISCTGTASGPLKSWNWIANNKLATQCYNQSICTWSNVPAGSYNVQVSGIDNSGTTTPLSNTVFVTVQAQPVAQHLNISCPGSANAGADISCSWTSTQPLTAAVLYVNDNPVTGPLVSCNSSQHTCTFTKVPAGVYRLYFKDGSSATPSNTVTVIVNPVTIAISCPSHVSTGQSITCTGTANGAGLSSWAWYVEGIAGSVCSNQVSCTWNSVPAGTYRVHVEAKDNSTALAPVTSNTTTVQAD